MVGGSVHVMNMTFTFSSFPVFHPCFTADKLCPVTISVSIPWNGRILTQYGTPEKLLICCLGNQIEILYFSCWKHYSTIRIWPTLESLRECNLTVNIISLDKIIWYCLTRWSKACNFISHVPNKE